MLFSKISTIYSKKFTFYALKSISYSLVLLLQGWLNISGVVSFFAKLAENRCCYKDENFYCSNVVLMWRSYVSTPVKYKILQFSHEQLCVRTHISLHSWQVWIVCFYFSGTFRFTRKRGLVSVTPEKSLGEVAAYRPTLELVQLKRNGFPVDRYRERETNE